MSTVTLVPVLDLAEGDVLPLMAGAVVSTVERYEGRASFGGTLPMVRVTFKEPVVSPRTEVQRDYVCFYSTDKVHVERES